MQWFYNLRISAKLISAFLVVLSLTTFLGVFSIFQLEKVNQTSTDMELNWMPSVRVTGDMNTNKSDFRIAELQHISAPDDASMTQHEKQMADITAAFKKNSDEYLSMMSSSDEQKLYDSLSKDWEEYLTENKKVIALSRANKDDEAKAEIRGISQQLFDNVSADLLKLAQLNVDGGAAASRQGDALYNNSRVWIISLLVAALTLGVMLAFFIARTISRPLKEAVDVATLVAAGDLTSKIQVTTKDETGNLMQALRNMNESLYEIVGNVRGSVDSIATSSKQIAAGNADLSQRTEEQASSLEETASSMEELTSTVKQNADNAKQANQLAVSASDVAVKGGQVVGQVVQTMASISTSSKKIVDIISVIEGIAFQTNILALNAAVEAARAGEQGRGFAVVAAEVRNLAQRSAAAAKEIKSLIGDSVDKVDAGSKLVDQAGATMTEIVTAVKRVTDLMSEIAAASMEQSSGIDQVNTAITQMDEVTQQNAALVEEAAAAAESMQEQANSLNEAVSIFKLDASARRDTRAAAAKPASAAHAPALRAPAHTPAAAPRKERKLIKSADGKDGDWKEF